MAASSTYLILAAILIAGVNAAPTGKAVRLMCHPYSDLYQMRWFDRVRDVLF